MSIGELEKHLRVHLGCTYGGPSISFQDGKFVLYDWGDGPVEMNTLAEGATLSEMMLNYLENGL